ncbi:hypothetical protein LZ30DRAFT_692307 [Colletotrichum cereale]|nr:hypothetical protein LZ30DRAFT_692307 [Colletotrichum cereale]
MSTSRTFHPFARLPVDVRVMIYRDSGRDELIQLCGTNRQVREEVLDYLYGELVIRGEAEDVHRQLRKMHLAPRDTDRLRPIPSATRIMSIFVIKGETFNSWGQFGSFYKYSCPPTLSAHMVAVLIKANSLQVLHLNLLCLDSENLSKLELYADYNYLPKTLKSLRLYGNDRSISTVMRQLRKGQLQSLALKGLSSYTLLDTLLEGQEVLEFELAHTTLACSAPAFLKTESLSLTVHANHDALADHLQDCLERLKYLSVVARGLPSDAAVTRLTDLYFSKLENLEYLVVKFNYPTAIMAKRVLGGIRIKTVHKLDDIAWPMMARVTGEYPRSWA